MYKKGLGYSVGFWESLVKGPNVFVHLDKGKGLSIQRGTNDSSDPLCVITKPRDL